MNTSSKSRVNDPSAPHDHTWMHLSGSYQLSLKSTLAMQYNNHPYILHHLRMSSSSDPAFCKPHSLIPSTYAVTAHNYIWNLPSTRHSHDLSLCHHSVDCCQVNHEWLSEPSPFWERTKGFQCTATMWIETLGRTPQMDRPKQHFWCNQCYISYFFFDMFVSNLCYCWTAWFAEYYVKSIPFNGRA